MKNIEDSWVLKLYLKFNGNIDHVLSIIDETKSSSAISYYFKNNKWIFEIYFNEKPKKIVIDRIFCAFNNIKSLKKINFELIFLKEEDWIKKSLDSFPPVFLGDFVFYGEHHKNKIFINHKNILLNSSMSFGSGSHPTTQGCIMAIKFLSKNYYPSQVLDLGSGSGILTIVAKKIWKASNIIALDHDNQSIQATQYNLKANNLCKKIKVGLSKTFKPYGGHNFVKFDLIIANIFAKTLKRLLSIAITVPSKNGFVVLSGILQKQKNDVLNLYRVYGFKNIKNFYIDGWVTIIMRKL